MLKAGDFVTELRIKTLANAIANKKQIAFDYSHSSIKKYIIEDTSY